MHSHNIHKRPASVPVCAVTAALAKRVRTLEPAAASDVVDLCTLLLGPQRAQVEAHPELLASVLEQEHCPRVADLLFRIAKRLDVAELHDAAHDSFVNKEFSDDDGASSMDTDIADETTIPGVESDRLSKVSSDEGDELLVPEMAPVLPAATVLTGFSIAEVTSDKDDVSTSSTAVAMSSTAVATSSTAVAYNKDTEIALSRIFELGKVAAVEDPSIAPYDPYFGPSVVSMSGFGELGRFGNQVLQYAFLRVYASAHGIEEVQVPAWVGAGLFGLTDRPVQRALPAVVESSQAKANSTFTTEFMDYIKASNAGRPVPEVEFSQLSKVVAGSGCPEAIKNVDFWGWFQWHTSCYAPYKSFIQDIFAPVPDLNAHMSKIFDRELRNRGGKKRTVVGLHLRLGDYQNIAASSFGYCAPTSWYLELLAKIWSTLDNPVLFVASDDIDAVLRDFSEYDPITADMAGLCMPPSMSHLKAGFFPDWWSLTQCDVTAISNSTFSFSACMVNTHPNALFYRAHYVNRMVPFDPWNSDPIIHRDMSGGGISNALGTLQVVYNTQGTRAVMRNVLYELPYYGLRAAIMKAVLWNSARVNNQVSIAKANTIISPVAIV
jgi:Glycosyl transferase family 11